MWIFRDFMGFNWIIKTKFPSPKLSALPGSGGRPGRRPDPESVDRIGRPTCTRSCTLTSHLGRSTERSTDCEYPTLEWGRSTGRSTVRLGTVDRPESNCSLELARSTGRSTGSLFWPLAGRPEGQSWPWQQPTASFFKGLFIPHLRPVFVKFLRAKISELL